jgi:hypothetical protein
MSSASFIIPHTYKIHIVLMNFFYSWTNVSHPKIYFWFTGIIPILSLDEAGIHFLFQWTTEVKDTTEYTTWVHGFGHI